MRGLFPGIFIRGSFLASRPWLVGLVRGEAKDTHTAAVFRWFNPPEWAEPNGLAATRGVECVPRCKPHLEDCLIRDLSGRAAVGALPRGTTLCLPTTEARKE